MSDESYYEVLGADPTASRDDLRAAYKERIAELEARSAKGLSEEQLRRNREEIARVRTAWNVLADPFQRSRYDKEREEGSADGGGPRRDVDGSLVESERPDVRLTGWRKLLAPPPRPAPGASADRGDRRPAPRPLREPTIQLPPGMRIAAPWSRGMAMLFDVAVVLVIYWAVLLVVPGLVNSEYQTKVDQIGHYGDLRGAQEDVDQAREDLRDAATQSDERAARRDLESAQDDYDRAARPLRRAGLDTPTDTDAIKRRADTLADDVRGAQYVAYLTVLGLSLLYLVPATAITGRTLGMRGRKVYVVRVDGSPVGWYGATVRFLVPILLALAIPTLGALLALGMVLWGLRDPNGQGFHDKLARTIIVSDA